VARGRAGRTTPRERNWRGLGQAGQTDAADGTERPRRAEPVSGAPAALSWPTTGRERAEGLRVGSEWRASGRGPARDSRNVDRERGVMGRSVLNGGREVAGVLAALATPLDSEGHLDRAHLERLVSHILSAGADGLSPTGSTGEGPLLGHRTRVEVCEAVAGILPPSALLVPGVAATTVNEVMTDLAAYAAAGAHAALVGVPSYYPLRGAEIERWFRSLADASPLPLVLYNIPMYTKNVIPPDVVARLGSHERIVGMKDSSRDMEYFEQVRHATTEATFSLLTGSDTLLLPSALVGADGTIAASVNLVPDLVVRLWRQAIEPGSLLEARELQARLVSIVDAVRSLGPDGWKTALGLAGLSSSELAHPLLPPSPEALDQLAATLRSLGVSLADER